MGQRIAKHVYNNETNMLEKSTYYVLDAHGNQMSMYEHVPVETSVKYNLIERNIYGSARVGTFTEKINVLTATYQYSNISQSTGLKFYEFTNHLGNVLAVFSDTKIPLDGDSDGEVDEFKVLIVSISDYSPFGVQLDGRTQSAESSRYGFQNQEKDDEMKGNGNSLNYEFRMHDPRVGRFFAVDPLASKYPHNSSYAFSENRVIDCIELEGLECYWSADGKTFIGKVGTSTEVRICNSKEAEKHVRNALFKQNNGLDKDNLINFNTGKSNADNYKYDCKMALENSSKAELYQNQFTKETLAKPIEEISSETSSGKTIKENNTDGDSYDGNKIAKFTVNNTRKFIRGSVSPVDYNAIEGETRFDCTAWVSYVFYKTGLTSVAKASSAGTKTFIPYMEENGGIRTSNPKVGDVAVWDGHVEIVINVDGNSFNTSGSSGSAGSFVPTTKKFTSIKDRQLSQYGTCKQDSFKGFWTPSVKKNK